MHAGHTLSVGSCKHTLAHPSIALRQWDFFTRTYFPNLDSARNRGVGMFVGTPRLKRRPRNPILLVLAWARIELSALWSPLGSLRTCLYGGLLVATGTRGVWFCCHLRSQSRSLALRAESPASNLSSHLLRSGRSGPFDLRHRAGLVRIHLAAPSHLTWMSDAIRGCRSLSSDAATSVEPCIQG